MSLNRRCFHAQRAPKAKWDFLNQLAKSRNAAMLNSLSIDKKTDLAAINAFMQLFTSEAKKRNFGHIATLLSVVCCCFLDSEITMKALVKSGLDEVILATIIELRKKIAVGSAFIGVLERLLTAASDLFEWEFFGKHNYCAYINELLTIVNVCDDCAGSVHVQAITVLMSMCSTNIHAICSSLITTTKSATLLKQTLHNIPCAKSFHYQALLLELAYRIQRHLKKSKERSKIKQAGTLVNSLPFHIAKSLDQIAPKNFRESTRELLNELNQLVGVIKSFKVEKLEIISESKKINVGEVHWLDFGGVVLEAELLMSKGEEKFNCILKLPFDKIEKIDTVDKDNIISLRISNSIQLADVIEGTGSDMWARTSSLEFQFWVEMKDFFNCKEILTRKVDPDALYNTHGAEAKSIKLERLERVSKWNNDNDLAHLLQKNKETEISQSLSIKAEGMSSLRRRSKPSADSVFSQGSQVEQFEYEDEEERRIGESDEELEPMAVVNSETFRVNSERKSPVNQSSHVGKKTKNIEYKSAELRQRVCRETIPQRIERDANNNVEATQHRPKTQYVKRPSISKQRSIPISTTIDPAQVKQPNLRLRNKTTCMDPSGSAVLKRKENVEPLHYNLRRGKKSSSKRDKDLIQKIAASDPTADTQETREEHAKLSNDQTTSSEDLNSRDNPRTSYMALSTHQPSQKKNSVAGLNCPAVIPSDTSSTELNAPSPDRSLSIKISDGELQSENECHIRKRKFKNYEHNCEPTVIPADDDAESEPMHQENLSFGAVQSSQFHKLQKLVDDIVVSQQSYRMHMMTNLCEKACSEIMKDVTGKTLSLDHDQSFHPVEKIYTSASIAVSLSEEQLHHCQDALNEVIDSTNANANKIDDDIHAMQSTIQRTAKDEWHQELSKITKKAKTQHNKWIGQTKEKLISIEKAYNTDDLMVMQQMLQRI